MIRKPCLLVCFLVCLLPWPALAQSLLVVRAGDQTAMSRLVVDVPSGVSWDLVTDKQLVTLRFPGAQLGFETSAIFPRRQASRVSRARQTQTDQGTELAFSLNCDCVADVFALGPRKIVVDIRDATAAPEVATTPPPEAPATPEIAPAPPSTTPDAPRASVPSDVAALPETADQPVTGRPVPVAPVIPERPGTEPESTDTAQSPTTDVEVSPEAEAAAIDAARDRLLEKLARAADQGLLDYRTPTTDADQRAEADPKKPEEMAVESGPVDKPVHDEERQDPPIPYSEPSLSARTARERDPNALKAQDGRPVPVTCIPDESLDLASWSSNDPVAAQIATLRRSLLGEFDKPDRKAVVQLAKLYIHYGFGVEAEALIGSLALDTKSATLLRDLARVIEGRPALSGGPLQSASNCPGRAALWHVAATGPDGAASADTGAVMAAFDELPIILRRLVGPSLVVAYLDADRIDVARDLLVRIARAPGDHGDAYHFARARLLDAEGDHAEAEAIFRALINDNRSNAAEAMVALVNSRLKRGESPPADLADDLATMAYQLRGTAEAADLKLAEIRARASADDLPQALALLADAIEMDPQNLLALQDVANIILQAADADRTGPMRYAEAVLGYPQVLSTGPSADPTRLVLARQMREIGLSNVSLKLLAPSLTRATSKVRMEAARAHLALNNNQDALDTLASLDDPEAQMLRASAFDGMRNHTSALAALEGLDEPDLAARLAWRAGLWSQAVTQPDPALQAMALYMAGVNPEPFIGALPKPRPNPVGPAIPPDYSPAQAFVAPLRLEEDISLGLANDLLSVSRGTRSLIVETLTDG